MREAAVREAFSQRRAEQADKLSVPVVLTIEQQPVCHLLTGEYCGITTSDTTGHTFLFSSVLRGTAECHGVEGESHDDDRLLVV